MPTVDGDSKVTSAPFQGQASNASAAPFPADLSGLSPEPTPTPGREGSDSGTIRPAPPVRRSSSRTSIMSGGSLQENSSIMPTSGAPRRLRRHTQGGAATHREASFFPGLNCAPFSLIFPSLPRPTCAAAIIASNPALQKAQQKMQLAQSMTRAMEESLRPARKSMGSVRGVSGRKSVTYGEGRRSGASTPTRTGRLSAASSDNSSSNVNPNMKQLGTGELHEAVVACLDLLGQRMERVEWAISHPPQLASASVSKGPSRWANINRTLKRANSSGNPRDAPDADGAEDDGMATGRKKQEPPGPAVTRNNLCAAAPSGPARPRNAVGSRECEDRCLPAALMLSDGLLPCLPCAASQAHPPVRPLGEWRWRRHPERARRQRRQRRGGARWHEAPCGAEGAHLNHSKSSDRIQRHSFRAVYQSESLCAERFLAGTFTSCDFLRWSPA